MAQPVADRLKACIETEFPLLQQIPGDLAARKEGASWSRKEELGHLIDSAANNHLRFAKAAMQSEFHGDSYDQDGSVAIHGYRDVDWPVLLDFWRSYNELLAHLASRIPEEKMTTRCTVGKNPPVTLLYLIEDYILHMQHHLDHILRRAVVTRYPRVS